MPDNFMLTTPLDYLLRLNEQGMIREKYEKSKTAEDKMTANQDAMSYTYIQVAAGSDNRSTTIHPARFLPGAARSGTDMWLMARDQLGRDGHPPVASYDLASCGLTGHVTARGWLELHNPSSKALQLKMFNLRNNANSMRNTRKFTLCEDDSMEVGESMRDIFDYGELKNAIRALREAMTLVMPWNRSIAALEGFLVTTNYCQADLGSATDATAILNVFIDHVLNQNAEAWRNRQPFLTASELTSTWLVWKGSNLPTLRNMSNNGTTAQAAQTTASNRNNGSNNSPGNGNRGKGKSGRGKSNPHSGSQQPPQQQQQQAKKPASDVCKRWNYNGCTAADNACFLADGRQLRHVCDYRMGGGKICGQNHQRTLTH